MNITNVARAAAEAVQSAKYKGASSEVQAAVRDASAKTGVDFSYLMEKAAVESSFQTDAKADTSSATGLYQFIDSTWLSTIKKHGAQYGLSDYANAIDIRSDGRPVVSDRGMKQQILDLRKDPKVSALMAAEFTKDNQDYLKTNTDGNVGSTELYLAHFLGAGGAAKFLNAMKENPSRKAADLLPEAAAANRNVFYDKSGEAKSLKQIYDRFAAKFDGIDAPADIAVTDKLQKGDTQDGFTTQMPSFSSKGNLGSPLSIYQILALNALETPDEADEEKPRDGHTPKRVRDQPVRTEQNGDMPLGLGLGRAKGLNALAA